MDETETLFFGAQKERIKYLSDDIVNKERSR